MSVILLTLSLSAVATEHGGVEKIDSETIRYFLVGDNGKEFIPYSSSQLLQRKGELVSVTSTPELPSLLNSKILASADHHSVLDRFLRMRGPGFRNPLDSSAIKSEFKPRSNAEAWRGFCHVWAGTSLSKDFQTLDHSNGGIACPSGVLTQGEVRELITAFGYRYGLIYNDLSAELPDFLKDQYYDIKKFWMSPQAFGGYIISHLKANRGTVVDLDNGPEIWNFPIYSAIVKTSLETHLPNPAEIASFSEAIEPWLVSETSPTTLKTIDEEIFLNEREMRIAHNDDPRKKLYQSKRLDLQTRRNDHILKMASELNSGQKNIPPGLKIERVSLRILYAMPSDFRKAQDTQASSEFEYWIAQKDGKSSSSWITSFELRPGHIGAPLYDEDVRQEKLVRSDKLPWLDVALKDLMHLLEKSSCVPMNKVNELQKILNTRLVIDTPLTVQETLNLSDLLTQTKSVIDTTKVNSILKEHHLEALLK